MSFLLRGLQISVAIRGALALSCSSSYSSSTLCRTNWVFSLNTLLATLAQQQQSDREGSPRNSTWDPGAAGSGGAAGKAFKPSRGRQSSRSNWDDVNQQSAARQRRSNSVDSELQSAHSAHSSVLFSHPTTTEPLLLSGPCRFVRILLFISTWPLKYRCILFVTPFS